MHTAFDDTRLHLLWLKFVPPGPNKHMLNWAWVLDATAATNTATNYPKKLDPELPIELDCLALFVATASSSLSTAAVEYVCTMLEPFTTSAFNDLVYATHPSLNAGELAHATLPFLLFAARVLQESSSATQKAIELGLLGILCGLWTLDFPRLEGRHTGMWVLPEKRQRAMRVACCLVLGAMAGHERVRPAILEAVRTMGERQKEFWDVVTFGLNVRVWWPEAAWAARVEGLWPLSAYLMTNGKGKEDKKSEDDVDGGNDENPRLMPGKAAHDDVVQNDENLAWILVTTYVIPYFHSHRPAHWLTGVHAEVTKPLTASCGISRSRSSFGDLWRPRRAGGTPWRSSAAARKARLEC